MSKQKNTHRRKKKSGPLDWLLNILIVALLVSGLYLIARPRIENYLQDRKMAEVLDQMADFNQEVYTITLGENDFRVAGEELEQLGYEGELEINTLEPVDVDVNMYATIQIPKIDLTMPVADEATLYSLRVSVGHWSPGAKLGDKGNAVIFGHRTYVEGRHFHSLHKLENADQIVFTTFDTVYTYEVDKSLTIDPSRLLQTITEPTDQARVILVTCTPLTEPRGINRLLVFGHLVEARPRATVNNN